MKIRIARQDLLDTVNRVKTVVSAKSALPILSHILFEARDSTLKLSATDLKVSIECSVDCTVEDPGSLTISSQRLSMILGELPNEEIVLELTESNVVTLTCGRIHTKLFSMAPEEFPPIRSFEGIEALALPQAALRKMFNRTSFAICTDQARYNLTGLLFELGGGRLTVVATDGRRMSMAMESENIPDGISVKVIIPGKMIGELERLLGGDGNVEVFVDETQAAFAFGNVRLVTALIEGSFPNYEVVIPKKHDKEALINAALFTEAVRRTRTMTNDKFNSVRFLMGSNTMVLKVVTPEVGEYQEDIAIEYDGEKVEIAFNPDFLLDVLRHVDAEIVCLIFKDAMSPGVVKPFSESPVDSYVNVVMPIRL